MKKNIVRRIVATPVVSLLLLLAAPTRTVTGSVTWLNETNLPAEADFANLQFPASFTNTGGASPVIFGQLYEAGVTEPNGASASVTAEVGYGPPGSDPRVTPWVWSPATFNAQVGNNDEYRGALTLPPGAYSYTFRFSFDGGASFTLADRDGAGSNAGLAFSVAQLGTANAAAPTLTGISPVSGDQGQTVGVTLTGTQFVPDATTVAVSGPGISIGNVVVGDAMHLTATFAIAGGAPATERAVTVTTAGGTSSSVAFTVNAVGNPPVVWLNETDLPGEADFANLQFAASFVNTGGPSPAIFGRLFELGVTEAAGPADNVIAQIGYGPAGTDPRVTPWTWAPATFNAQIGNDDEYQAGLTLPAGAFSYTFRFSVDGGFSFTLADLNGAGANSGLVFAAAQLGMATTVPTLSGIDPTSAPQGQPVSVTLTGTQFVNSGTTVGVTGPGVSVSNVQVLDSMHLTATFTIGGGAPATARTVTVTTVGGTSTGVTFTVTAGSNPPVIWLNETDSPGEADFANLQFPATFTNTGAPSPAVFGRVFETGVTEAAGPAPSIVAEIGYGPAGTDPRVTSGWVWAPAAFNAQAGNDDEYQAVLTLPPGSYSYTFRFSLDGGFSFTLADLDGAGANTGLTFSTAQLGSAVGVPAVPVVTLKVNGQHPPSRVVTTAGPASLTLSISASSYTGTLSWYWVVVVNGQVYFVTPNGASTTPAPLAVAPPAAFSDLQLLNVNLPSGITLTNVFMLVDGTGSAVGFDVISAARP